MSVNFNEAIAAYNRTNGRSGGQGMAARDRDGASEFGQMLRNAAEGAIDTLRAGEAMSIEAAAGKADLNDVVVAVSKAELTLQTVVSIRDRAIQAYQEILRMPI